MIKAPLQPALFLVPHVVARPDLDHDGRLAEAALAGKPDAHRALWARFLPLVRRLVSRQLGPDADIDDLVQDVFELVFRDLKSLREPRAIGSFVGTVAVHAVGKELRRRRLRRLVTLTATGITPEPDPAETDPVERLALRRAYALLETCGTAERMIFVLRYVEGQSVEDVAFVMGVSPATVKRKAAKVVARLSALVQGEPFLTDYLCAGEGK